LISVCFAAAFCYYFFKNQTNERTADVMRDQVLQLQEQNDSLRAEKEHLQASMAEAENQIKAREDLVTEKENELAAEEMRVESLGHQGATNAAQNQAQVAVVRKFNDVIRKLGGPTPPDVVERFGRPVLRVPNSELFAPGDTALTPDGQTLLNQIAQAISGQMDNFELRVVCYTDATAEAANPPATPGDSKDPATHQPSWDLTAARAASVARFLHDQTPLPPLSVLVTARGDLEPLAANLPDERAHNRRVEITVAPLPVPFRSPDGNAYATPVAAPADATSADPSPPAASVKKTHAQNAAKPPAH
jgi:flagellar motor protein MotB